MLIAKWRTCPGIKNDGLYGHSMRDGCSSCSPYWEQYPACPTCNSMLGKNNSASPGEKRKCPKCNVFVKVEACDVILGEKS